MTDKIILIYYISGTGGQYLEYLLMRHKEIFHKGYTCTNRNNEYWNVINDGDTNFKENKKFNYRHDYDINYLINFVKNYKEDKLYKNVSYSKQPTEAITLSYTNDLDMIDDDVIILGININNNCLDYLNKIYDLKLKGRQGSKENYYNKDRLNKYKNNIIKQNKKYFFINYENFFIKENLTEYIEMCKFLKITPDIKLFQKSINLYMYQNGI